MLLAMISIGIFAVPIVIGLVGFVVGLILLPFFRQKNDMRLIPYAVMTISAMTAIVPAGILAFILISARLEKEVEYKALPGKVEVDIQQDKNGFLVDGEYYKRLPLYRGDSVEKSSTGITLVDGLYTHFPLEQLNSTSPYDLYYTNMFGSVYCREEDYDAVVSYYDQECPTRMEIRDELASGMDYTQVSFDQSTYNIYYHLYYPKGLYASQNADAVETKKVPFDSSVKLLRIMTTSADGIYYTETKLMLRGDEVYLIYRHTDTEAVAAQITPEAADFFRQVAAKYYQKKK